MDKSELERRLEAELERVQDLSNYTSDEGGIDEKKAEMVFKRVDAVEKISSQLLKLEDIRNKNKELQLSAVRTAIDAGYSVDVRGSLGLELKHDSKVE